ncbi:MAG: hypothetical protein ACI9MC_003249, partial [Kiritimatiellia bacterium]
DLTDPCPLDRQDDSLTPGVCDSDMLTSGTWCSHGGPLGSHLGWAVLLPFLALVRRRRTSPLAESRP